MRGLRCNQCSCSYEYFITTLPQTSVNLAEVQAMCRVKITLVFMETQTSFAICRQIHHAPISGESVSRVVGNPIKD